MATILVLGAGKSATVLIRYLIEQSGKLNYELQVADTDAALLQSKIEGHPQVKALILDSNDHTLRRAAVTAADIVISMLPPTLHADVAAECLAAGTHLLTASYVDERMRSFSEEARARGLLFLCEMGLDPGIDHMSSMQMIENLRAEGAIITSFRSHCGGLVAPACDNNPWRYKISWNPRNVVVAGKAGAIYISDRQERRESYEQLFSTQRDLVTVPGLDPLAWYPNRDSVSYRPIYGLEDCTNFVRTTLRYQEFIAGWNWIVNAGLTDETGQLVTAGTSEQSWWNGFASKNTFAEKIAADELLRSQLDWLGRNSEAILPFEGMVAPALVLQYLLEKNLALAMGDRDMIVMQHEIEARLPDGQRQKLFSSLVLEGDNELETAMSKTVGLPLAVAALQLLQRKIHLRGLQIPILPEIYQPVLAALQPLGIAFNERKELL